MPQVFSEAGFVVGSLEILDGRGHHCLYAALQKQLMRLNDAGKLEPSDVQKRYTVKVTFGESVRKGGVVSYELIERSIKIGGIVQGVRSDNECYKARRKEYLAFNSN